MRGLARALLWCSRTTGTWRPDLSPWALLISGPAGVGEYICLPRRTLSEPVSTRTFGLSPLWQHYRNRCERDVLFEQDSFAPRELQPPSRKGDQQEAEVFQGPEDEQDHCTSSSYTGFAIIDQESLHPNFTVSIVPLQSGSLLTYVVHSTRLSSRYPLDQLSVSSQHTKTSSASHHTFSKHARHSSSSLRTNASRLNMKIQRCSPLSWNISTRATTRLSWPMTRSARAST